MRVKRPDYKNAESLLATARTDVEYTLTLAVTPASARTIIRNIYESFRMLGDALLTLKGLESTDHTQPIQELLQLEVQTKRPLQVIDYLRRLRHNINYYGYAPSVEEAKEAISIAKSCFEEVDLKIKSLINRNKE